MTTEKMMTIGKLWEKGGMKRIYVNLDKLSDKDYDEIPVRRHFNRYEWQNLKIYWDCAKDELVISIGSDEAKAAITAALENM